MLFEKNEKSAERIRALESGLIAPAWLPLLFLVGLVFPPLLLFLVASGFLSIDPPLHHSPAGAAWASPIDGPLPPAPPRSPPV